MIAPDRPTRPLIGISGRRTSAAEVRSFPPALAGLPVDLYLADYADRVLDAGGLPVHLPMCADAAAYLPWLDGLLLSGGADVDPSTYGAEPDGNGSYEPERDRLELELIAEAERLGLPVLGICRGMQLINVAAGGTLHQHVPAHARYDVDPAERIHEVRFEPESVLGAIHRIATIPEGPMSVNSLHHQTVDQVGDGLRVVALSDDGTIEGLESADGRVVAVQWHPEMLPATEPVFGWLARRTGGRADRG